MGLFSYVSIELDYWNINRERERESDQTINKDSLMIECWFDDRMFSRICVQAGWLRGRSICSSSTCTPLYPMHVRRG